MVNVFGIDFDENYLWTGILITIVIICTLTSNKQSEYFEAPFIPAQPWIEYPEYPAPYRGDELYLGGSTKCFSCEKDMIKRGLPTFLAHPTKCFDCDSQAADQYGPWAGHFGQNNKCFSCEAQYAQNPFQLNNQKRCGSNSDNLPQRCGSNPFKSNDSDGLPNRCGSNPGRYGRADGKGFYDRLTNDGVGLVKGFGQANGMGDYHEGDTQNPIGYTLS